MSELRIDRVRLEIEVGNDRARKQMRELEGDIKKYSSELKKLGRQAAKNDRQRKETSASLKKEQENYDRLEVEIEQLTGELMKLESQGRQNTKEYKEAEAKLKSSEKLYEKFRLGIERLEKELRDLENQQEKNTQKHKETEAALKKARLAHDKQVESIGMNNLSVKELTRRQGELNAILKNLNPNTDAYKRYARQLSAVNSRLTELRAGTRAAESSFSRLAERFNKYESIFTWFTAALVGFFYSISQFVRGISEMSDAMGEVMKTTGMTLDQVRELKQEFKTFETRTASRELLNIAYQAGKLGMKTKEEIAGFVKEADIAVVSLGKALGGNAEETINTLGKIIGAFQLEQTMGWEKAMRHTGAVINELGKRSTASEDAIVNYMARLASVGVSLKIPMENIAGIGATLDSLKVPAEQGSTAVQKFLLTIASESGKLSRFLGVTKQQYEKMVEKDIMGVMLMLLRTAKAGNKGLFQMVQQLDSMDVTGVRMINTVSQMINNVDTLAGQMKIAGNEFKKGTSTLNEFNIMNNTFAARMAKVKKEINSIVYGLGVKLEPVILSTVEGFGAFLKFLQRNTEALAFLGKLITVSITSLISYAAAVKLVELWTERATAAKWLQVTVDKVALAKTKALRGGLLLLSAAQALLTGNVRKATAAMRLFNITTKLNPIGLLISLLTAATAAYFAFREEEEKVIDRHAEIKQRFADERVELELAFTQLKQTTEGTRERARAIHDLNAKYGDYLPNLLDENASLEDINRAQERALELLELKMKYEIRLGDIRSTLQEEHRLETEFEKAQDHLSNIFQMLERQRDPLTRSMSNQGIQKLEEEYIKAVATQDRLLSDLENIEKRKEKLFEDLSRSEIGEVIRKGTDGGTGGKVMPEIQFSEEDLQWAWNEVSSKKKLGVLAKIELEEEGNDIDPDLVEKLFNKLGLRKMELEEVKELIGEINKEYGEALPTLLNEKSTLDEIQKAQENIGNTTEDLTGKEREKAKQLLVELELRKKALEETKGTAEEINSEFGGKLPVLRGEYGWQLSDSSTPEEIQKAYDELQKIFRDNDTKELDYWTEQWKKTLEGRAAFAKAAYDSELISFSEYQDRLTQIEKEKSAERARISAAALDGASRLFEAQASYNRAQMNRELEAAGDSEERKDRIRRKYARKQQQIDIKQALIDQAKGIVKIWSEFGKLPPLAAALTAIEVAHTASQIAVIESQQFAKGRYNVKGKDDGHIYKDVPFIGEAKTGIRTRPALISERGSEGIVDHRTLFSGKTDSLGMTAMDHFRAITALRYNTVTVPRYAEGRYTNATDTPHHTTVKQNQDFATRNDLEKVLKLVMESNEANRQMVHNLKVHVNAREVKEENDRYAEIESRADA